MKRNIIVLGLIAALFTMVSCQKDQTLIRASITRYNGADKVHLNSTNYACWDGNETIWINGNSTEYPIIPISENDNEHFMINMGDDAPESGTLYAIFHPSTVQLGTYSSTDNTIGITLPATQTYSEDGQGNQVINAPMVTTAEINSRGGADLVFNNVCSLLKVQLRPNVIVYWIEVTSDNAPLAGAGTLDISNAALTMTGTTTTVKLNVNSESSSNYYCREDGVYYIVLPPYMGSNLTVTVYDNPKTLMTFSQNREGGHSLGKGEIGVVDVATHDIGRGIFSVGNGIKVSFAPGNLTGSYAFTSQQYNQGDVYAYNANNISTYSNAMGSEWMLLSSDQWDYLFNRTDTYNGNTVDLVARASVNGTKGLIVLPDNWFSTMGCPVYISDNSSFPNVNTTANPNNWTIMENNGVLFLPVPENNRNHYWTSTPDYVVIIGTGKGEPVGGSGTVAHTGQGTDYNNPYIRLAHIVENSNQTNQTQQ